MKSHWTTYFFSGSIAIIASWVLLITLSSCRVGDNVVYPPPADPVSGYYATSPQSLTYSINLGGSISQQSGATNTLPSLAASIFTNLVIFQLSAPGATTGALASPLGPDPTTNPAIPLDFNSANSTFTAAAYAGNATDAWQTDSSCTLQTLITVTGALDPLGSTPSTAMVAGNAVALNGRLSGTVTVQLLIQGTSCESALEKISQCYADMTQCDSTDGSATDDETILSGYQQIFGPWVDDAKVLTAAEIAQLSPNQEDGSLAYQIQYQ